MPPTAPEVKMALRQNSQQPQGPLSHREVRSIIVGIVMAMLLAALDQTIVATALPTIGRELGGAARRGAGTERGLLFAQRWNFGRCGCLPPQDTTEVLMDPILGMALWPIVLLAIAGLVVASRAAAGLRH
jgi:hypothetical protein